MTSQVYFWQTQNGAWQLARKVSPDGIGVVRNAWTEDGGDELEQLVLPLYSTEPVWVPESKLLPYPSAKIEEPTK